MSGKKRNSQKSPISKELAEQLRANPYVRDIQGSRIKYTTAFFGAMYNRIQEGDTYQEAMKSLGFDTEALGKDRVKSVGQRAKEMGEKGYFKDLHPEHYDGSTPLTVEELRTMPREELLNRVLARNLYLEVAREYEKKTPFRLGDWISSVTGKH